MNKRWRETAVHAARFADTVGDGTGSINANVDGSVTPVDFKVTIPAGKVGIVHRLIVTIRDSGSLDSGLYGNNITLVNGIDVIYKDPYGNETVRSAQHPIKSNIDWAAYCYDVEIHPWGSGDQGMFARYTFTKDGAPLVLPAGSEYIIRINDDLTGLTAHHFRLGMAVVDE